jgi:hypothetical protein
MRWLAERGVISSWQDYEALPVKVYDDCLIFMEAEAMDAARSKR